MNSFVFFFIRYDLQGAIAETQSMSVLAFHWLAIFTCWLRSFGNDIRNIVRVFKSSSRLHFIGTINIVCCLGKFSCAIFVVFSVVTSCLCDNDISKLLRNFFN